MDLNKEAKEYAKSCDKNLYGYDGNSFSPEDEKQIQDFIAGANSKYVQAKVIQAQIDVLKEVDFNMYMLLKNEATNLDLAEVDVIYRWNKTKWHLEIDRKIKELQRQLKNLENEK